MGFNNVKKDEGQRILGASVVPGCGTKENKKKSSLYGLEGEFARACIKCWNSHVLALMLQLDYGGQAGFQQTNLLPKTYVRNLEC